MLPILSVSASVPNLILILTFPLPRKVIFKLTLVLKLWLVCTTFFAIILLHPRFHSLKNYSLILLQVSTIICSIIITTNTPRMTNQPILLTHQFLHFIPTIQPIFPNYFYIFLIFSATPKILPQGEAHDDTKRLPAENDRRLAPARGSLFNLPDTSALGQEFHPFPPLSCGPILHLPEELTALEKIWLFQPINEACNSKRALSPAPIQ